MDLHWEITVFHTAILSIFKLQIGISGTEKRRWVALNYQAIYPHWKPGSERGLYVPYAGTDWWRKKKEKKRPKGSCNCDPVYVIVFTNIPPNVMYCKLFFLNKNVFFQDWKVSKYKLLCGLYIYLIFCLENASRNYFP